MGTKPLNSSRISKHISTDDGDSSKRQQAYEITSLPDFVNAKEFTDLGYKQHAGQIALSDDANYFFWLIHNKKPKGKLLIWLNGGPGCTSTDGLILERGVFNIKRIKDKKLELTAKKDGWHSFANVLALDQPVGTGYSNTPKHHYSKTLEEIAKKFDEFLTKFFELFPEYASDEIYLGGESYAGIWIPTFANYTLLRPEATKVNLKGLMIGNGWIDPKNQYPSLLPMVKKHNLLEKESMEKFQRLYDKCIVDLKGEIVKATLESCEKMATKINELSIIEDKSGNQTCINQYDIRLRDRYPDCGMGWPPSISEFYEYMRKEEVIKALHAHPNNNEWEECSKTVYKNMDMDKVSPTINLFPELLKKVHILLFGGEYDFMVNNIGTSYLVGNLTQHKDIQNHRLRVTDPDEGVWIDWGSDPKVVSGQLAKWGNLNQAKIYNASHMPSYDQPGSVGSLMRWFTSGRPSSKIIPEPDSAPGFFIVSKMNNTKTDLKSETSSNHTDTVDNATLADVEESGPTYTMWMGVLVAFAVLGCLVVGLVRSRHRNPFRPDHQELLNTDADEAEMEMENTRFNESSPVAQDRNSGDDYAFEFHDDNDEEDQDDDQPR